MIGAVNDDPGKEISFNNKNNSEDELVKLIDDYDRTMLRYLGNLYEALNGEKMDLSKVKSTIDALQQFNSRQEYNYLNNLLHPEKCKGVKIPSPIPVPSCSFQLHNCVTLTTNASGNLALVFNPFFLASTNALKEYSIDGNNITLNNLTTLWVNNNDSLSGSEANQMFRPVNIGQVIPPVYDQYRLVSASLIIKYIGRLDIASGVIGGAIVFDEDAHIGGSATGGNIINMDLSKYGNFDLAMDSFYHQENLCLEGLRELYFPIDNSFEEYVRTTDGSHLQFIGSGSGYDMISEQDYYKSGFNWMVYVLGAPATSACFKLDIYCNYECLPNASFLNYLPLTMSPKHVSAEEKRQANLIVQKKPIMKIADGEKSLVPSTPNIFYKMISKFGNSLPGISKLISKGLVSMVPGLKPGLSLAGAMLGSLNENVSSSSSGSQQVRPMEEVE